MYRHRSSRHFERPGLKPGLFAFWTDLSGAGEGPGPASAGQTGTGNRRRDGFHTDSGPCPMQFLKTMIAEPMAWIFFIVVGGIGLSLAYIVLTSLHI